MKTLLTLCLAAGLVSAPAHAQEAQPTIYGQYYTIVVTDPAAVVSAMTRYRESATGQKLASNVQLTQFVANGGNPSTHAIAVFYPTTGAMTADHGAAAGSQDWLDFLAAVGQVATVEAENVFTVRRSRINDEEVGGPGSVGMLFALNVTDPSRYVPAMNGLFDSAAAGNFPGNIFAGEVLASGEDAGTHWVNFVARDIGTLLAGMDAFGGSDDFASYATNADDFRQVVGRTVSRNVRAWGSPGN